MGLSGGTTAPHQQNQHQHPSRRNRPSKEHQSELRKHRKLSVQPMGPAMNPYDIGGMGLHNSMNKDDSKRKRRRKDRGALESSSKHHNNNNNNNNKTHCRSGEGGKGSLQSGT